MADSRGALLGFGAIASSAIAAAPSIRLGAGSVILGALVASGSGTVVTANVGAAPPGAFARQTLRDRDRDAAIAAMRLVWRRIAAVGRWEDLPDFVVAAVRQHSTGPLDVLPPVEALSLRNMAALSPEAFDALPAIADKVEREAAWVADQQRLARARAADEEAAVMLLLL